MIKGLSTKGQRPKYDEGQLEAATTLEGLKQMLAADPAKVVHEDEEGQQFTEQDYAASLVADRINKTPFYQKEFNIGGDSGRKVIGFQPLVSQEMLDHFGEEKLQGLPRDAFVPIIQNEKTKSTGPMTKRESADPDDEVQYITLSHLEQIAAE